MECHRCPFFTQPDKVRAAVCVACATVLPEIAPNSKGQTMVGYEALIGTKEEPRTDATGEGVWDGIDRADAFDPLDVERFTGFLGRFMALTPDEFHVLSRRYAAQKAGTGHPTLAEIGREMSPPQSKQNVYAKMNNCFKKVPELEALFPGVSHTLQPWQRKARAAAEAEMHQLRQGYLFNHL